MVETAPAPPASPDAQAVKVAEDALVAAGKPTHDPVQHDYFAFDESGRIPLPDKVSYIEHQVMNEGAKRKYLNNTNRKVNVSRVTGDASISAAPGDERAALLSSTISGWNLKSQGQDVPFSKDNLARFLDQADPKVVDLIEKEIRLANPWLLQELTIEDIDTEIESLQQMRAKKLEEEAGKDDLKR